MGQWRHGNLFSQEKTGEACQGYHGQHTGLAQTMASGSILAGGAEGKKATRKTLIPFGWGEAVTSSVGTHKAARSDAFHQQFPTKYVLAKDSGCRPLDWGVGGGGWGCRAGGGEGDDVDKTQMVLAYHLRSIVIADVKRFILVSQSGLIKREREAMKPIQLLPIRRPPLLTPGAMIVEYTKLKNESDTVGCSITVVYNPFEPVTKSHDQTT